TVYLDSSVLLRVVFNEPDPIEEFSNISHAVSSELIRIECLRTTDRLRLKNGLSEDEYVRRVDIVHKFLKHIELVRLSAEILNRASQPFPTALGTLDAIHLSTCLLYKERVSEVPLYTHDEGLKKAASALGLEVHG
ncbi:MAG: type II toxin-antitoxin system VapC family toxin, partial [Deltaproteobacteria bacterium]|nr:type II toxin-antitoxin system VapC family toxin [Deltaproteobacteria bacterium]